MGTSNRKSIFVVEADHNSRVRLRSLYEAKGHKVFTFGSSVEALGLLKSGKKPSVILVGVTLPLMSASEFLQKLENDEHLKIIPVFTLQKGDKKDAGVESNVVHIDNEDELLKIFSERESADS